MQSRRRTQCHHGRLPYREGVAKVEDSNWNDLCPTPQQRQALDRATVCVCVCVCVCVGVCVCVICGFE